MCESVSERVCAEQLQICASKLIFNYFNFHFISSLLLKLTKLTKVSRLTNLTRLTNPTRLSELTGGPGEMIVGGSSWRSWDHLKVRFLDPGAVIGSEVLNLTITTPPARPLSH